MSERLQLSPTVEAIPRQRPPELAEIADDQEQSPWLRKQLGDLAVWKDSQQEAHVNDGLGERIQADQEAWTYKNDISARIAEAKAGDTRAAGILMEHVESADPAELAGPEYDTFWKYSSYRQVMYKRIGDAAERSRHDPKGYNRGERALIQKAFAELRLSKEQGGEIWQSWASYRVEYVKDLPYGKTHNDVDPKRAERFRDIVMTNLKNMDYIHEHEQGGVGRLHDRDGIRNFWRYDPRELAKQSVENPGKPDRVVLAAGSDWSASTDKLKNQIAALQGNKLGAANVRIVEATTSDETRNRLKAVADQYGPINDLMIVSHSDEETLELSEEADGALTIDNVRGTEANPAVFDKTIIKGSPLKRAIVVLLGCKAGKEKGIASEIALATGAKVFASEGLVTGVRRTRFGGIQLLDAQGENTVVHWCWPATGCHV